ncbi:hypothetical protein [Pandoraea oxalativorans]|uniref:Uncharacterized protein n=1 Tax=Pandoraea oxalativorans TaxID=573737 RepID=A0A0G3ICW1_9BURK|nr:hypothetical protein [Pandoraea oxalativorans]AKK25057.1 hypothetical protein MB84_30400 [Pandoraea oxalativorans]
MPVYDRFPLASPSRAAPSALQFALKDNHVELLAHFKNQSPDTRDAKQFIKEFSSMTPLAWLKDLFSSIFRLGQGGSQRELQRAVAYQVAASTKEGYQQLVKERLLDRLRDSNEYLLKHMTPEAHASLLETPLVLRDDGQVMAKARVAGPRGEVSFDFVLTPECFVDYTFEGEDEGRLTRDEIADSCWMANAGNEENIFLRELLDHTARGPQPFCDNRDTLELIMTGIMGPGSAREERPEPTAATKRLCEQLAQRGLRVRTYAAGQRQYGILADLLDQGLSYDDAMKRALQHEAALEGFHGNERFLRWDRGC